MNTETEREQVSFRSYYAAKQARYDKPRPSDWIITLERNGWYRLIKLRTP